MHILALETTGKYGSAAVIDQEGNCWTAASSDVMNHLKDIITLTEECLRNAGIEKTDLTHIGASVGPGSFTGIRIGVTTARTLGQVLDLHCVSVSTLEAMAYQGMENSSGEKYICPIINARRHQTYAGLWKATTDGPEPILPEKQYMIEDLMNEILHRRRNRCLPGHYFHGALRGNVCLCTGIGSVSERKKCSAGGTSPGTIRGDGFLRETDAELHAQKRSRDAAGIGYTEQ